MEKMEEATLRELIGSRIVISEALSQMEQMKRTMVVMSKKNKKLHQKVGLLTCAVGLLYLAQKNISNKQELEIKKLKEELKEMKGE